MSYILDKIHKLGLFRVIIISIFIVVFGFSFIDSHIRFPDIDQKLSQVERIFQDECSPKILSSSVLIKSEHHSKREVPSAVFSSVYSTNKTWGEISTYYEKVAKNFGWEFIDQGNTLHLKKGKMGDEYKLFINQGTDSSTIEVSLYWSGNRPILNLLFNRY